MKAKSRIIQISNIAPQATKDQMSTLFGFLGKIEDIRLYPTVRDVAIPVQSRICFIKFMDRDPVGVAQHLTNTVFIDRALIVIPFTGSDMVDEPAALEIMNSSGAMPGMGQDIQWPTHVKNQVDGIILRTIDPRLTDNMLPEYPNLPATTESYKVNEIRRTLVLDNIDCSASADQVMEFAARPGEVRYLRMGTEMDGTKNALVEYCEQTTIIGALQMQDENICGRPVKVNHSTVAIIKPQTKSNEAAQREIEEAMRRVKEAQNSLFSANMDPLAFLDAATKTHDERSRSRERKRRSRSRSQSRRKRSRSRRKSRSRSRSRKKSRSKSRSRKTRSRSRSRKDKYHSSSHRDRDRDKKREKSSSSKSSKEDKEEKKEDVKLEVIKEETEKAEESSEIKELPVHVNGKENNVPAKSEDDDKPHVKEKEEKKESKDKKSSSSRSKGRSRSRSRSRSHRPRKRSRTRSRSRRKSKSRTRSPRRRKSRRSRSRSKSRRTRSRSRSRRAKSKDRHRSRTQERTRRRSRSSSRSRRDSRRDRSRSRGRDKKKDDRDRDRKDKKKDKREKDDKKSDTKQVSRDYDEEEVGYEGEAEKAAKLAAEQSKDKEETVDMDISNSP